MEETKEVKRGDCGHNYLKLGRKKKVVMKEVWHHSQSLLRARADLNGTCVKPRFTVLTLVTYFHSCDDPDPDAHAHVVSRPDADRFLLQP